MNEIIHKELFKNQLPLKGDVYDIRLLSLVMRNWRTWKSENEIEIL